MGLRVKPSQKYPKKCLAFSLLFDCNAAWTGFLTKYSEFDLMTKYVPWANSTTLQNQPNPRPQLSLPTPTNHVILEWFQIRIKHWRERSVKRLAPKLCSGIKAFQTIDFLYHLVNLYYAFFTAIVSLGLKGEVGNTILNTKG